ncbi:hypothetical protein Tco_1317874 [Tanacetum coccineum]
MIVTPAVLVISSLTGPETIGGGSRGKLCMCCGNGLVVQRSLGIEIHGKVFMNLEFEYRVDLVPGARQSPKISISSSNLITSKNCLNNFKSCKTKVSYDLVIFHEEHQCCLLKRGAWSSFEVRVGITEEGEVKGRVKLRRVRAMSMTIQSSVKDKILATSSETSKVENTPAEMLRDLDQQMEKRADDGKANVVTDALSRKERVKPRRVRAMAMIIQYGVRGMILAAQSEAFKQENVRAERLHGYHSSNWCAPFEALYGMKCRSPVLWAEIGESSLTVPELILDMTDKVVLIKEKLKAARDRQKSYADNRRKPLEFEVGDRVMLKVSPWKGVIRFGKKGKLAPRYVGPFEILERVGPVAYRLRLPEELSGIKVDKTLRFVEEPVENSDREVKRLKCSRMVVVKAKWLAVRYLVKVSWNSKCNFELTWVWEDYLKDKFDNQSIERDRLIGIGFVLDFVEFISFTFSDKEMILVIEAVSR